MAKVTIERITPIPVTSIKKVILELTFEEAAVLKAVTRKIGGTPTVSYRGVMDSIGLVLNDPDIMNMSLAITGKANGNIHFLDGKVS